MPWWRKEDNWSHRLCCGVTLSCFPTRDVDMQTDLSERNTFSDVSNRNFNNNKKNQNKKKPHLVARTFCKVKTFRNKLWCDAFLSIHGMYI